MFLVEDYNTKLSLDGIYLEYPEKMKGFDIMKEVLQIMSEHPAQEYFIYCDYDPFFDGIDKHKMITFRFRKYGIIEDTSAKFCYEENCANEYQVANGLSFGYKRFVIDSPLLNNIEALRKIKDRNPSIQFYAFANKHFDKNGEILPNWVAPEFIKEYQGVIDNWILSPAEKGINNVLREYQAGASVSKLGDIFQDIDPKYSPVIDIFFSVWGNKRANCRARCQHCRQCARSVKMYDDMLKINKYKKEVDNEG